MHVDGDLIAVGVNCVPGCIDWGSNGIIAYGASSLVALYQTATPGHVFATLRHHTDRVNCVKWLDVSRGILVSGSVDKTLCIWSSSSSTSSSNQWSILSQLKGHTASIAAMDTLVMSSSTAIIVSAGGDCTVRIWHTDTYDNVDMEWKVSQVIELNRGHQALAVSLAKLPNGALILAIGTTNSTIQLYAMEDGGQFKHHTVLDGHTNWVSGLAFTSDEGGLLLASCSQDCYVRLWRIAPRADVMAEADAAALINDGVSDGPDKFVPRPKVWRVDLQKKFGGEHVVLVESVLHGHDDYVTSVSWSRYWDNCDPDLPLILLSTSLDKTMAVWEFDISAGIWCDSHRLGELSSQQTLGLFGGTFSPNARSIICHSYQCAFHLWTQSPGDGNSSIVWHPEVISGGHFGAVEDVCWEPDGGNFLLSVSADQTTRVWAPWAASVAQSFNETRESWHEIARPQIHGYDMRCAALVPKKPASADSLKPYVLASGADEKILRIFESTWHFEDALIRISRGICEGLDSYGNNGTSLPMGAALGPLQLSNKAVNGTETDATSGYEDRELPGGESFFSSENPACAHFEPVRLQQPPFEEHLLQNTLWPEKQKLYGHGFELFALAASNGGDLIATASKATQVAHAGIRLWSTIQWCEVCPPLISHDLTVTQLAFSNNDEWLLSVSRDRKWSLFKRRSSDTDASEPLFTPFMRLKAHERIIWDCSWSHDDQFFATASRDKTVKIWHQEHTTDAANNALGKWIERSDVGLPRFNEAMTALAWGSDYLLAVGDVCGDIIIFRAPPNGTAVSLVQVPSFLAHSGTVRCLKWRPHFEKKSKNNEKHMQLASCGNDFSVRVLNVIDSV